VIAGTGQGAPQVSAIPRNNTTTAVNKQMFQQYVMPPYYSIMPHGMMNLSTGASGPSTMAGMAPMQQMPVLPMMMQAGMSMAWGQHMPGMQTMMAPGMTMASGLQLPTPAMYMQPGMGMAFQGYAMQQLQQGNAMCKIGNTSS
jgi:hypothetical protein